MSTDLVLVAPFGRSIPITMKESKTCKFILQVFLLYRTLPPRCRERALIPQ